MPRADIVRKLQHRFEPFVEGAGCPEYPPGFNVFRARGRGAMAPLSQKTKRMGNPILISFPAGGLFVLNKARTNDNQQDEQHDNQHKRGAIATAAVSVTAVWVPITPAAATAAEAPRHT